ncbi:MAG: hypothetical protein M1816_003447 [Peltula sp. TS41687]|nr:MAG: hypothetical protein M1816_003447 [Peltula sp. TS41687]
MASRGCRCTASAKERFSSAYAQGTYWSAGKLLTTPSRLLKLVLPLGANQEQSNRREIEPLALLVHPHQPLSYLERLIQSELPAIRNPRGQEKSPSVFFWAKDPGDQSLGPVEPKSHHGKGQALAESAELEASEIDGDLTKTGKLNRIKTLRGGPGEGGVESYSSLGHESHSTDNTDRKNFVRWSASTEIGDFIREAARDAMFEIEIEGSPERIPVGVPSFDDRTHYMRMRLHKLSENIAAMAAVKEECDRAAHQGARQVAVGGFGLLAGWWGMVYWLTFKTSSGWDFVEPVTYLVGLTTVMGGYLWFLYNNREVSYRAALNLTVSRRQNRLYQARGFDVAKWQALIEEANTLRKEIRAIGNEYDVDWNEEDEADRKVVEVLEKESAKKEGRKKGD